VTKFCLLVDIHDLITYATFGDDRLRGLGMARGRISCFPIVLRRRPYNTRTTMRVCELYTTLRPNFYVLQNFHHKFANLVAPPTNGTARCLVHCKVHLVL